MKNRTLLTALCMTAASRMPMMNTPADRVTVAEIMADLILEHNDDRPSDPISIQCQMIDTDGAVDWQWVLAGH